MSAWKQTQPLSMTGVHPVFCVTVLYEQKPDLIREQQRQELKHVELIGKGEW